MWFFKVFFTYLLLSIWHLACTRETEWSSSLCFSASLPSFLYLNITEQRKVAEKLTSPLTCAKVSCHFPAVLTISFAMSRHVGVLSLMPSSPPQRWNAHVSRTTMRENVGNSRYCEETRQAFQNSGEGAPVILQPLVAILTFQKCPFFLVLNTTNICTRNFLYDVCLRIQRRSKFRGREPSLWGGYTDFSFLSTLIRWHH